MGIIISIVNFLKLLTGNCLINIVVTVSTLAVYAEKRKPDLQAAHCWSGNAKSNVTNNGFKPNGDKLNG